MKYLPTQRLPRSNRFFFVEILQKSKLRLGKKNGNTSAEWHHRPFLRKQESSFVEYLEILDSRLRDSDSIKAFSGENQKPSQEKTSGVLHSAEVIRKIKKRLSLLARAGRG